MSAAQVGYRPAASASAPSRFAYPVYARPSGQSAAPNTTPEDVGLSTQAVDKGVKIVAISILLGFGIGIWGGYKIVKKACHLEEDE